MPRTRNIVLVSALAAGSGLVGGIVGYVVNDLTEKENAEVMTQIRQEQQLQQNLDDFFDQLAADGSGS